MTNGVLAPDDVLLETYRIVRQLGEGGTGEVYLAKSTATGREVAIKVLKHAFSQDPNFIKLLERELFQNVKHDAVVTYLDLHRSQEHGGLYFLVMEYIDGPALSDLMAKGPVDQVTLMEIGRRVSEGLKAAHAVKVFHRDISPDNIILRHGDPAQATLIDFGIAKDKRPAARTVIGDGFAGKYEYAAPEQIDGAAVDGRADIYALGATLLAAARGKVPEMPVSRKAIEALKDQPLDVAELPQPLAGLIRHMSAPLPESRIGSAAELLRSFESGGSAYADEDLDSTRIGAAPPMHADDLLLDLDEPEPDRTRQRKKRGMGWLLWPAVAVLILVLGGFAWQQGWLSGLLKPSLPVANPYRFTAVFGSPSTVDGNAPSEEMKATLLAAVAAIDGTDIPPTAVIDLADGMPSETWDDAVLDAIAAIEQLDQWRIDVIGTRLVVRGLAESKSESDAVEDALEQAATIGGLTLDTNIRVLIAPIPLSQLAAALAPLDRCGGLSPTADQDPVPPGADIRARGNAPDQNAKDKIERALGELSEGRRVDLSGIDVLNPFVCRLLAQLAPLEAGSLRFQVTEAQSGRVNSTNNFQATDDPVIDLLMPERAQGHLSVFLANNEGAILHLLPYQERAEHRLDQIGSVEGDQRRVRVAFSRSDPSCERCALNLNSEPFGVNYVFAILTDQPLFDGIRIRIENLDDFAPDLAAAVTAAQRRGALQAVTLRRMRVSR